MNPQLPKKYQQYCLAMTYWLFTDMLNPKNQGPNFTWDKFPDMAKRRGISGVGLYFINVKEKHKEMIGEICEDLAKDILKRSEINIEH